MSIFSKLFTLFRGINSFIVALPATVIPILIAAHRPRMLRLAARFADQWDTFAEMPADVTMWPSSTTWRPRSFPTASASR